MAREQLPELDGVRAASILLVLATHLLPLGPKSLNLNEMTGPMGMSLFFCLSGFLITKFLYERPDVADFFRRRLARIVPLILVYAFVVAILMNGRWDTFASVSLFYINYDDAAQVEGVQHLWSVCVEAQFYLAIGLAVRLMGRKALWLIPVAALVVLGLRIEAGAYVSIRTHLRVDEILSGGIMALIWLRSPSINPKWATVLFWLALPLLALSSHPVSGPLNYARPYFAAATVGASLFMSEGRVRALLRTKPLAYIARISYALYVWHPLMALGWLGSGGKLTLYVVKRPVTFALTFLAAYLSTSTFEAYFRRLARRETVSSPAPSE